MSSYRPIYLKRTISKQAVWIFFSFWVIEIFGIFFAVIARMVQ